MTEMEDKLLLIFGCSWAYGKYINLKSGEKKPDVTKLPSFFQEEAQLANSHAYRSLIAKHFQMSQKVFAEGGSSNQRQFRLASQYFLGPDKSKINNAKLYAHTYQQIRDESWPSIEEFKFSGELDDRILQEIIAQEPTFKIFQKDLRKKYVLWFITSTARTEFFDSQTQQYKNEFLTWANDDLTKMIAARSYDHTNEVQVLSHLMTLWNSYFQSNNITNIWIDTFNHHNYPIEIKNYIKLDPQASDIMSNMCIRSGYREFKNDEFHISGHAIDDSRSKFLVENGYLNSQTLHPTLKGHQLIADILIPVIEKYFVPKI